MRLLFAALAALIAVLAFVGAGDSPVKLLAAAVISAAIAAVAP